MLSIVKCMLHNTDIQNVYDNTKKSEYTNLVANSYANSSKNCHFENKSFNVAFGSLLKKKKGE